MKLWMMSNNYFLQEDIAYGRCRTPLNEVGQCRHLEYCVQDTFRNDYLAFVQYVCSIENTYVGVCCPQRRDFNNGGTEDNSPAEPEIPETPRPKPAKKPKPKPTPETPPEDEIDFGFGTDIARRECGISEKQVTRIVGGRKADPKAWPWMAALLRTDSVAR